MKNCWWRSWQQIGYSLLLLWTTTNLQAETVPVHGYSLYGPVKYTADFSHFDYVNPHALKGGTITFAPIGSFDSLNPFVVKGNAAAGMTLLHSSYFHATLGESSHDEIFSHYGYIAESFELDPNRSWIIFNLRGTARFHDGNPIQADDVIYSFESLTKHGHPLYAAYYKDVKAVEKINDRRVKFIFATNQNRELPLILAEMPILSKKYWTTHGFDKADLTIPVGSGPYKIASINPGRSIVYERIPNWWGENIPVNRGRYNFDRIRYDYYRDDTVAFEAFKSGDIDFRIESTAKNWAIGYDFPLFKEGKIVRQELSFESCDPMMGFVFNLRRDFFKDIRIRRAIANCFDFEWINKNLFYHHYKRAYSYFNGSELAATGKPSAEEITILKAIKSPVDPAVFNDEFTLPITDGSGNIRKQMVESLKLFKEAGYQIQNGQLIHTATKQPFKFKILLNHPQLERMAQSFVTNLKKLGIDVTLQVIDSAQYTLRVSDFDFDMVYSGYLQSLSPGNEQRDFWKSDRADLKGGRNLSGIKDPVIDEIVEKLIDTPTRPEQVLYAKVLDRLLLWGYYLVPSYYAPFTRIAYNQKLKHSGKLPRYLLDIDSWWIAEPAVAP